MVTPRRLLSATAVAVLVAIALTSDAVTKFGTSASAYALNEPDQATRLLRPPVSSTGLLSLLGAQWDAFFKSFWGIFGWFTTPLSPDVNMLLSVVSVLSLIGLLMALVTSRGSDRKVLPTLVAIYGLMVLTLTVLAFAITLSYFSGTEVPQGRHIFGVLVPIAVLFAIGIRAWLPARWLGTRTPATVVVALLVLLDVAAYTQSFAPYFLGRSFS
jgi:hypothetical protein